MENEPARNTEISAALHQGTRAARFMAQLDLDRDQATAHVEQQVDLRSRVRSPEIGLDGLAGGAHRPDDLLDHPPLPRRAQLKLVVMIVGRWPYLSSINLKKMLVCSGRRLRYPISSMQRTS